MAVHLLGGIAVIGERIKSLRKEKGLLQRELAKNLGMTQQTISLYESGHREPDWKTLNKIAEYFNVSVDFLLGNTDEPRSADKVKEALSDYPELLAFWEEQMGREEVQLFVKQLRELSPNTIINMVKAIKGFEDDERRRHE